MYSFFPFFIAVTNPYANIVFHTISLIQFIQQLTLMVLTILYTPFYQVDLFP